MLLTKHTDLALRVLMHLEMCTGQICTVKEIAEKYKISRNHLVKVVHSLAQRGYILSTKGRGGGLKIAPKGSEATVGIIVREMENTLEVFDCAGSNCPLASACKLQSVVNEGAKAFLKVLDQYKITDLVKNKVTLLQLIG